MKVAIYPGSFNPWHEAHEHILTKALQVFDFVYVARGRNHMKPVAIAKLPSLSKFKGRVKVEEFTGTLADYAKEKKVDAIVRGLRNVFDFYEEKDNQYWHEDLGLKVPIFYIISDRNLGHISSKAVRIIQSLKEIK